MPPSPLKTLGVGLYRSSDRPWLVTVYGYLRAVAEHTVVLAIFIAALAVSTGLFEVARCIQHVSFMQAEVRPRPVTAIDHGMR